jgi:hypothetical protein
MGNELPFSEPQLTPRANNRTYADSSSIVMVSESSHLS